MGKEVKYNVLLFLNIYYLHEIHIYYEIADKV